MTRTRQSRHWHDLAVLADHKIGEASLANRELLEDVVRHKSVFFRASYAKYDACLSGGLHLIPGTTLLQALGADYEKMIADGMFEGEPPSFEQIVARLKSSKKKSTRQVNRLSASGTVPCATRYIPKVSLSVSSFSVLPHIRWLA